MWQAHAPPPPSASFLLLARSSREVHNILIHALLSPTATLNTPMPDVLAARHLNCYCDALPKAQPVSCCSRFRLQGGMLALLTMRLAAAPLSTHREWCRAARCCASRVSAVLLAHTGEGLHHAALQLRASCQNEKAAQCFARAVELQHGPSHAELSYMFIGECSLPQDLSRALHIAEAGASLGCNDSKAALASCLRFKWLEEDRAVQLATESASAGSAWGCSEMGLMLQHGIGVEKDLEQAVCYTSTAARLGNAWARHNLGVMFARGVGVEQDYDEAARYGCTPPAPNSACKSCFSRLSQTVAPVCGAGPLRRAEPPGRAVRERPRRPERRESSQSVVGASGSAGPPQRSQVPRARQAVQR